MVLQTNIMTCREMFKLEIKNFHVLTNFSKIGSHAHQE